MRAAPSLIALFLLAALGTAACRDTVEPPPPPPVAGVFHAHLESPHGAEAAALISIDAVDVDSVTADDETFLIVSGAGPRLYIALVRSEPAVLAFSVHVRNTRAALDPHVLQVATDGNGLRTQLAGYGVAVGR